MTKYYISQIVSFKDILNPYMDFTNEVTDPVCYESKKVALDFIYKELNSKLADSDYLGSEVVEGFLNRNDLNFNSYKLHKSKNSPNTYSIKSSSKKVLFEINKNKTITSEYFIINEINDKDIAYLLLETLEGDYFSVDRIISNDFIYSLEKANKELLELKKSNEYAMYRIDIVDISKLKNSNFYKNQFKEKLDKNLISKDFFNKFFI